MLQRRSQRLPALRGSTQRVAAPATLFRPPGRPCRKESQTFSLIPFRILWIASAVGCHVNPRTRVSGARAVEDNQSSCLQELLEPEPSRTTSPRVYKSSWKPEPWRTTSPRQLTLLEPETTAGQPAPLSTKAPRARDHCGTTSSRVYKSSWNPRPLQGNQPPCLQKFLVLSTEGNRPSSLEQVSLPETAAGQPAPASTKAAQKLEHLGTTSPTVNQPSPFRSRKNELPFKACTA